MTAQRTKSFQPDIRPTTSTLTLANRWDHFLARWGVTLWVVSRATLGQAFTSSPAPKGFVQGASTPSSDTQCTLAGFCSSQSLGLSSQAY
jgi:hypothetical protein